MAKGLFANQKMRQFLVIGIIIALILVMFGVMLLFGVTEEEDVRSLEQQKMEETEITTEISMADSDYITIEGTRYPHPDKLYDIEEIWIYGTDEFDPDSDNDSMEDGWEAHYGKIDLLTGLLTLDPMRFDSFENPDGDGWDNDHNGRIDGREHLTNLEEYCGGSFNWGPFKAQNLDPQAHYENYLLYKEEDDLEKMQEEWDKYKNETLYIQYHGGFHLIDYPYSEIILDDFLNYPTFQTNEYSSYNPNTDKELTTDPSNSDSDFDRMNDGFEIFFREKAEYIGRAYIPSYNRTFNPLDPNDAYGNYDIRKTEECIRGEAELQFVMKKDNLTNIQEYENGTDPTMYDSDDDSYYDQLTGTIQWMSDDYELTSRSPMTYKLIGSSDWIITSSIDWDYDGIINTNSNPNSKDTDGDYMGDGWEENFGLNPCNSSDRFLDNDNDGLPNYLEFAYPNASNVWFRTMPNNHDTDEDGMPDGWEAFNTKIIKKEVYAGYASDIKDGLADGIAFEFTVNPMIADSEKDVDGVWYNDQFDETDEEVYHKSVDNMTNLQEYLNSINPNTPDTDGDGLTDGEEVGYWYCSASRKTITWWICENEECSLYNKKIPYRICHECGDLAEPYETCDSESVILRGGFYGKLLAGRWITDPNVADIYFTNASSPNTDGDFGTGDIINESRFLDDWEEINGMQHANGDNKDNDGDGEFGSPTTWLDYNKNGEVESFEVSNWADVPMDTDEKLRGGVFGAVADGEDNDGDGFIDEGIDEDGEGITFTPTNASYYDTDHDGLPDVNEIFGVDTGSEYDPDTPESGYGTVFPDPGAEDSDEDFLNDYLEVIRLGYYKKYITNPLDQDSDGDGLTDGREWEIDFYPLEDFDTESNYDANGDGIGDQFDNGLMIKGIVINNNVDRTNPRSEDTDRDDLPDGWEYDYGKTKLKKLIQWHDNEFKTSWVKRIIQLHGGFDKGLAPMDVWVINPVGQNDKYQDPDGDGLKNWDEYLLGTDPLNWDSDGDGLPDGWEIQHRQFDINYNKYNLDPSDADTIPNDILDDEDGDGNDDPCEEIIDGKDNDGDGEVVAGAADGLDNDGDGLIDECDEVSYINWLDDDGDGKVDEGIDEEWDMNDANEDYDWDGVWYTIAWVDDDGDGEFDEDPMDDDGDGRINEDPADGLDNDGDDLIDEDTGGKEDDDDGDWDDSNGNNVYDAGEAGIDEDPKKYYHPFTNLMEYTFGNDLDGDGMNEMNTTTWPNERDTDYDGVPDGWEIWYEDLLVNESDPRPHQDNDSLVRGWEDLFNGSLVLFWSDYTPRGLLNPDEATNFIGKFDSTKADSNNDGVPDGEENYDGDRWENPHDPFPEQAGDQPCNNSAEYSGHSDPTYEYSTPKVEISRNAIPMDSGDSGTEKEGTSTVQADNELEDFQHMELENTVSEPDPETEKIVEFEETQNNCEQAVDINKS